MKKIYLIEMIPADYTFDERGRNILQIAVIHDDRDILKVLLSRKHIGMIDYQDYNGDTALNISINFEKEDIAFHLLIAGANFGIFNKAGFNAFTLAIRNKNIRIVKELIKYNYDVNIANAEGNTSLMIAAQVGDIEIFREILRQKPRMEVANKKGLTALMFACALGHAEIVTMLLSKEKTLLNVISNTGDAPLAYAASAGKLEVVKILVEYGVEINAANKKKVTAILLAAKNGHKEVVRYLINNGANIEDDELKLVIKEKLGSNFFKEMKEASTEYKVKHSDGKLRKSEVIHKLGALLKHSNLPPQARAMLEAVIKQAESGGSEEITFGETKLNINDIVKQIGEVIQREHSEEPTRNQGHNSTREPDTSHNKPANHAEDVNTSATGIDNLDPENDIQKSPIRSSKAPTQAEKAKKENALLSKKALDRLNKKPKIKKEGIFDNFMDTISNLFK